MTNPLSDSYPRSAPPGWLLLAVSLVAGGAAIRLAWGARPEAPEVVRRHLSVEESAALSLNLGTTLDVLAHPDVPPRVGGRYRVRIEEAARQQADGVARIGGRVTFVSGARAGEVRTVEVISLRGTIAEAVPLGPPESAVPAVQLAQGAAAPPAPPANLHTAVVEGVGSRGDGRVMLDGLPVYIPGAAAGERVVFEIVRRGERSAIGRLVEKLPAEGGAEPVPVPPANLHTAVVEGVGSRGDGRVMLDGLPVYIPGAAAGERVVFEIVRRGERSATGRLVAKLRAEGGGPSGGSGPLRVGDVLEVTITERAYRAPDRDGVARVGGFPVIVPGTQTGQTLRVRILEIRERHAVAERLTDAP
ncbi:MAG: TRAM domain-containing protein [Kiritimatiellae bacterium]|nr:TRAM domain-containing protein [Kiritimatiellia bacterium]